VARKSGKTKTQWPDEEEFLQSIRNGVFDDRVLRVGLLGMGPLPGIDPKAEILPKVERAIRREANRVRAEAGLPLLPEVDK
jgi:hypothetical protein